jgi:hypothetical protein
MTPRAREIDRHLAHLVPPVRRAVMRSLAVPGTLPKAGLDRQPARYLLRQDQYATWFVPDQRPRQTCVAYAAAACIEVLRAYRGEPLVPLSAQFLYWYMRTLKWPGDRPPGWAFGATRLGYAKSVLASYGICREAICRNGDMPPGSPLEGPKPSRAARREAADNLIPDGDYWYIPDPSARPSGIAQRIYKLLADGRPVAIALPEFAPSPGSSVTNWYNATSWSSGIVADPPEGHLPSNSGGLSVSGHAVCIIGFEPDPAGGWFLFRNSVGKDWAYLFGEQKPAVPDVPCSGYGAISATQVEAFCWEMFSPKLPYR